MTLTKMHRSTESGMAPVPAFLTKLWSLVEGPVSNDLISWDPSGKSFHVFDQARFSKEILPLYFKHSNMSSFIRQLNMYGFRKVSGIEHGGLVKHEKDDLEFQHLYFQQGKEHLLENIKRKVGGTTVKPDELKLKQEDVSKVLTDVRQLSSKQDRMNGKLGSLQRENEILWREIASLRQKHSQQQTIVNKLVQFLVTLVGSKRGVPVKRQIPMLEDSPVSAKVPKYTSGPSLSIRDIDTPYAVQSPSEVSFDESLLDEIPTTSSIPVIEDVTPCSPKKECLLDNITCPEQTNDLSFEDLINIEPDSHDLLVSPDKHAVVPLNETDAKETLVPWKSTAIDKPSTSKLKLDIGKANSEDVTTQLETLTSEIDTLKELLSGGQYFLDSNSILDLFNPDQPLTMPDIPIPSWDSNEQPDLGHGSTIIGNELVEYHPPSLYDFSSGDPVNELLSEDAHLEEADDLVTPDLASTIEPSFPSTKTYNGGQMEEVD